MAQWQQEHEAKRRIEALVFEHRCELEDDGLAPDEIDRRCVEFRARLKTAAAPRPAVVDEAAEDRSDPPTEDDECAALPPEIREEVLRSQFPSSGIHCSTKSCREIRKETKNSLGINPSITSTCASSS